MSKTEEASGAVYWAEMTADEALAVKAVILEQWLRFYCLEEDQQGKLRLQVPVHLREQVGRDDPRLLALLDRLSTQEVDARLAVSAVLDFLQAHCAGVVQDIVNQPSFQDRVAALQQAVHEHAEDLETCPATFSSWLNLAGTYIKNEQ